MENFIKFFLHPKLREDSENFLKGRLFFTLLMISVFLTIMLAFDVRRAMDNMVTYQLIFLVLSATVGLLYLRLVGNLRTLGFLYALISWVGFSSIIATTGGGNSPAIPSLLTSIIPAFIFGSRGVGTFWFIINFLTASIFIYMSRMELYGFDMGMDPSKFFLKSAFHVGQIVFTTLVFVAYLKYNELIKGNLKNVNFDLIEREKQVKASEEKFRAIAENFPNGLIVILDKDLNFIDAVGEAVNKAADEISNKEFLGLNMREILGDEEFKIREPYYLSALTGKTAVFESFYEGDYYLNSVSPIMNLQGEVERVLIASQYITDQKQNELKLEQRNRIIGESFTYAKRIQDGLLGNISDLHDFFPNSFLYFQPKELLSGDFYWFGERDGKKIIIAADCTGHGVPGALMTMIGINFLNEIVYTYGMTKPDLILHQLDQKVTDALINQNKNEIVQDGMDIAVLTYDSAANKMYFSGAMNPLFICRKNGENQRVKGCKFPIGSTHYGFEKYFESHEFEVEYGDKFYIYSDGFQDQMGGHNGKKYKSTNFRELLSVLSNEPMKKQGILLEKSFIEWKSDRDQIDDVLVIGIEC